MSSTNSDNSGRSHRRKKAAHGPTLNAIKKAKYEAKQKKVQTKTKNHPSQSSWFNGREDYAVYITVEDVRTIKRKRNCKSNTLNISQSENRLMHIATWIEPFFDMQKKEIPSISSTNTNNTINDEEKDRLFIAEGTETVRMMIQQCEAATITHNTSNGDNTCAQVTNFNDIQQHQPPPIRLVTILSKPATFFDKPIHLFGDIEQRNLINKSSTTSNDNISSPPFKIVIANEDALTEICGFKIARGAMACGVIPTFMQSNGYTWLKRLLKPKEVTIPSTINALQQNRPIRKILAIDAISNAANMGSIIRTAAAFSIDAIILSNDSCDAWYRQSVRCSMGHVINIPIMRVADCEQSISNDNEAVKGDGDVSGLAKVLRWLRSMNVECLAAVVDDDKDDIKSNNKAVKLPPLVSLEANHQKFESSWCCVLGNEGNGIREEVIRECDKRIKISMASSVDSLSLPIAAGILMYTLSSRS